MAIQRGEVYFVDLKVMFGTMRDPPHSGAVGTGGR